MKALKIAVLAITAAAMLSGCCCKLSSNKCYPYPLYSYSPSRVCGSVCNTPCAKPACNTCKTCK